MRNAYATNTLVYDRDRCGGCGMCSTVCPHGVFVQADGKAELVGHERCMECGACSLNCPTGAIEVESGVGCAAALMAAALRGRPDEEATCGPSDCDRGSGCCS